MRALLLVCLIGCADLPDLGICGNGVVEEANGEACDDGKDTASCNASCELKCLTAATDGYVEARTGFFCPTPAPGGRVACGLDTVCRQPSGELEPPTSPVPFDVRQIPLVADFDGDGYSDLIGTSATSIVVRFGGAQSLATAQIQEAPSSLSPLLPFSVGDRTLLAVPTEGVALLESDGEQFVPSIDFVASAPGDRTGVVVRDPDAALGDVLITVRASNTTPDIAVARQAVQVGAFPGIPAATLPSCTATAAGAWHTAAIEVAADRRSFVIVTVKDAAPFAWHICRYTPLGTTWSLADLEFPGAITTATLANLDSDACEELLVQSNAAASYGRIDAAGPTCGFVAGLTTISDDVTGDAFPILAAGQIVPGGTDEIVTTQGVFECAAADCSTGLVRRISPSSALAWTRAAVTDLNGDGAGDVVAARAVQDDVDVVRGGTTLNVYRSDTASPVTSVLAGDFDGDRLGDVALVETSGAGDRLAVLYGTREGPLGAVHPMTAAGGKLEIQRLVSYSWLPTARASDGIDDVLVVRAQSTTLSAGLAMGDAARIMTTPRFPPAINSKQEIGAVIAGRIGSPDVELATIVASGANTTLQLYNVNANMWAPPLTLTGASIRAPLGALHGVADQDTAVGLTGSLTAPNLVTFSARSPMPVCAATSLAAAPRELRGVDLDGDQIDELVVLTGELANRSISIFDTGSCPAMQIAKMPLDNCVDIASIDARTITACRTGPMQPASALFAVTEFDREPQALARLAGDARFLASGDFDGDGLLDLAVGVSLGTELNVQILKQCPAHDTRRCR
jgi:hypothetical protein